MGNWLIWSEKPETRHILKGILILIKIANYWNFSQKAETNYAQPKKFEISIL
jgi:hypothetical protein